MLVVIILAVLFFLFLCTYTLVYVTKQQALHPQPLRKETTASGFVTQGVYNLTCKNRVASKAVYVGLSGGHDPSAAMSVCGEVLHFATLSESIMGLEAFGWQSQMDAMRAMVQRYTTDVLAKDLLYVAAAVITNNSNFFHPAMAQAIKPSMWLHHDHHEAHALHGLYTSPFQRALIFVTDHGGSSPGVDKIYMGIAGSGITLLRTGNLYLAKTYMLLCTCGPFLNGRSLKGRNQFNGFDLTCPRRMMALADSRAVNPTLIPFMESVFAHAASNNYATQCKKIHKYFRKFQAVDLPVSWASTAQHMLHTKAIRWLEKFRPELMAADGLVLVGGVAMNAKMNYAVAQHFRCPFHVPPAPHDLGVAFGLLWSVAPPSAPPGAYLGACPDTHELQLAAEIGARINHTQVALLLAEGLLVGTIIGRKAVSPNSLGVRSVFAVPDMRSLVRLDRWMHSNANPTFMVPPDWVPHILNTTIEQFTSPYALMQVPLLDKFSRELGPGLQSADGVPVQTMLPEHQALLSHLLASVKAVTGRPVLMHAALGCGSLCEALEHLRKGHLDALVVDEWLITEVPSGMACSRHNVTSKP